jgi:hypothetical protein
MLGRTVGKEQLELTLFGDSQFAGTGGFLP